MLDKNSLLQEIKLAAQNNIVSKKEILETYSSGQSKKHPGLSAVLSYIGGAIVLLGIVIFFSQQWDVLSSLSRIFVTLGVALILYIAALLFNREAKTEVMSYGLFIVAFLLLPTGFYVSLNEMGLDSSSTFIFFVLPSLLCAIVALASAVMLKRNFFYVISIIYSTWFYYALISWIFERLDITGGTWMHYIALLQGVAWIGLGYFYHKDETRKELSGFLYGFGSLVTLAVAFSLATDFLVWLWLYPVVILLFIYASVKLSSRSFLVFGALFLIGYISYVTGKYFASSVGWPIALIFIGLAIIGISVGSININKIYLSKKTVTK